MAARYTHEERVEMYQLLKRGCSCEETATILNILYKTDRTPNAIDMQNQYITHNVIEDVRHTDFSVSDDAYKEAIKCAVEAGYF